MLHCKSGGKRNGVGITPQSPLALALPDDEDKASARCSPTNQIYGRHPETLGDR